MDGFVALDSRLIRFEVEQNINYHCIVCKAEFLSRDARNEHLETHFIHRNCGHCQKAVIVIGDLEFELHRPIHCHQTEAQLCESTFNSNYKLNVDDTPNDLCNEELGTGDLTHYQAQEINEEDICSKETVNITKKKRKNSQTKTKSSLKNIETKSNQKYNVNAVAKSEMENDIDALKLVEPEKKAKRRIYAKLPKTIPCSKCDMLFGSERTVKIHMHRVHGIKQQFICPVSTCQREFKVSGNFKQHMETHSDHKRYICEYCPKAFHLRFNLKEHMNVHTGSRPYKCDWIECNGKPCGKTFGRNTLRQAHMRVHTGERPYVCSFLDCDRAYAYQTDLKRHKRSAHGIITKTFPCSLCPKLFFENKFLTKHMKVHQS